MGRRHDRGLYRHHITTVGFVAAGALLLSQGVANAEPTPDEVRDKIEGLEQEFSKLNETYNQAKQDHDAAQQRLEEIQEDLDETRGGLEGLEEEVRTLATAAYSGVDFSSPAYLISSSGPEGILGKAADLGYLSSNQEASLELYAEEQDELKSLEEEAEQTEDKAAEDLEEAKEARKEGEDKIEEQEELLNELSAEDQEEATQGVGSGGGGGGSGGGGDYTGPASGNAKAALDFAYAQIGEPYVWGGTGPDGWDCSGLTQGAWAEAGVSLPRTSQQQFNAGQRVSWDNIQPGDLLFFYDSAAPSHVGMYAGNGMMVHASTSSKPVMEVELSSYYRNNFVGGVRP